MFELNLLARHVPSGESFMVELASLPTIHKLLQQIQCLVETEYTHLTFPSIPDLFYTHDDLLPDTLPAPLSTTSVPQTGPPLPEASLPVAYPPQSLVKPEPSLLSGKLSCPLCKKDIKSSNWSRNQKTHKDVLVCEGICQFSTKYPKTMANHRDSDDCLRYMFVMQLLMADGGGIALQLHCLTAFVLTDGLSD